MSRSLLIAGLLITLAVWALCGQPVTLAAPEAQSAPQAITYYVGSDADTSGLDCTVAEECTLRSAMERAQTDGADSIILFAEGPHTITLGSSLPLLDQANTTIQGYGQVWVDANGAGTIFTVSGEGIKLDGMRMYGSALSASIIWVAGDAKNVEISNNVIGRDGVSECGLSDETPRGIDVDASTAALAPGEYRAFIYNNDIRCIRGDPGDGIRIANTTLVVVGMAPGMGAPLANYVGSNGRNGITVQGGGLHTIRATTAEWNGNSGIVLSGTSNVSVQEGSSRRNGNSGIELRDGTTLSTVGCLAGSANLQAGVTINLNGREGVYIAGEETRWNGVRCNTIEANGINGVVLDDSAHWNDIGATSAESNVIIHNGSDGVQIANGAHHNTVSGNYIGTWRNTAGDAGNYGAGIAMYGGAQGNLIGGTELNRANVVGWSHTFGIRIDGSTTSSNTLQNNLIGASRTGSGIDNLSDGIAIVAGAHDNEITGTFTTIANNRRNGVAVTDSPANRISGHAVANNRGYGVILSGAGTTNTVISDLEVAFNDLDGIGENGGANNNWWTRLTTQGNLGMGVDTAISSDPANERTAPYPAIAAVDSGPGVVTGKASPSDALWSVTVELYRSTAEASGFAQGDAYVGSAQVGQDGVWSISDPQFTTAGGCYVAFETHIEMYGTGNYSSELGPSNCGAYLPLVARGP